MKRSVPKANGMSSAEIRQSFLDFFASKGHIIVPSASLVPGDDPTLLFTNAGMVQFKDVFLDVGSRKYSRATDSQKCMRVAGKHNDLDDVGRDDWHHTFFEMLGNWSFGDYYKAEAIEWAWTLLTDVWGLPKEHLYATVFEDEKGEIPRDDEAAEYWKGMPGFLHKNLLFFGRKENFWEMADVGPCGPDSEIHFDRGAEFCDRQDVSGHVCSVNGDCSRYLELWNLVFIQYERKGPNELVPLPKKHIDTGLGFERIVSVIQAVDSNYKTDLFLPLIERVQQMAGHSDKQVEQNFTPYRVIADHVRAATFLIADGVVPGNLSRNYVCRMIIRRASRFGSKLGFNDPFLAAVAQVVIENYGEAYPELMRNKNAILNALTEEEERFHRTVDNGVERLTHLLETVKRSGQAALAGDDAFDLYATYGLPLEITRDIARENGQLVDEEGFLAAMEIHRQASGAGQAFGEAVADDIEIYQRIREQLISTNALSKDGVTYDPYSAQVVEGEVLSLIVAGQEKTEVQAGMRVGVIVPATGFYVEAGGQVSDTGRIISAKAGTWEISIQGTRMPVKGLIIHLGEVVMGSPKVGDKACVEVDSTRRGDIMRNHTATHLLHAALQDVLGDHARQAGSLVSPERLRFDFTHSHAMTIVELLQVEQCVNANILANYRLQIRERSREDAIAAGAMALFGETYGDVVRTVEIGDPESISFELCAGTHVTETGGIGLIEIVSEGSVAAGIRRIEAVTGRVAVQRAMQRRGTLRRIASRLGSKMDEVEQRVEAVLNLQSDLKCEVESIRKQQAMATFEDMAAEEIEGISVLTGFIPDTDVDTLREMADRYRSEQPAAVVVFGSVSNGKPILIAAVSQQLPEQGLHAGDLIKTIARVIGGGGGGKPTMAQAGGKDPEKMNEALAQVKDWVRAKLA